MESNPNYNPVSYETTVQCDGRFVDAAVYVVEHDHAILYAGLKFNLAQKVVRGFGLITVWMNDELIGTVNPEGKWTFKSGNHPDKP